MQRLKWAQKEARNFSPVPRVHTILLPAPARMFCAIFIWRRLLKWSH